MDTTLFDAACGKRINNRYEVIHCLGVGAMGAVFAVKDRELRNDIVALKLLHPHHSLTDKSLERFRSEVLLARKLVHPHIVRVYELDKTTDGQIFISMEYVEGKSLSELLENENGKITGLPFDEVVVLLHQIADALTFAHALNIVHRDVKPQNILVTTNGIAKLTDFGIARSLTEDSDLTQTGAVLGTPYYMSPEQFCGHQVDPSFDVYAFGIMAWELIAGQRPFNDDNYFTLINRHLSEELPSLRVKQAQIPLWLDSLIISCCAKDPKERPPMPLILERFEEHNNYSRKDSLNRAMELLSVVQDQELKLYQRKMYWKRLKKNAIRLSFLLLVLSALIGPNKMSASFFMRFCYFDFEYGELLPAPIRYCYRQLFGVPTYYSEDDLTRLIESAQWRERDRYSTIGFIRSIDNPNIQARDGMSGLMMAARYADIRLINELLIVGADPNLQDQNGKTALHYTTENRLLGGVAKLVNAGANLQIRDNNNFDAIELALKRDPEQFLVLVLPVISDVENYTNASGQSLLHLSTLELLRSAEFWAQQRREGHEVPKYQLNRVRSLLWLTEILLEKHFILDQKDLSGSTPIGVFQKIPNSVLNDWASTLPNRFGKMQKSMNEGKLDS